MPLGRLEIAHPLNMNCDSPVIRRRGTFILICTTVGGSRAYPTSKRISDMKVTIVELLRTVAAKARPDDIIDMNTCDEALTQPPLIPFCEATKVIDKKNLDLINTIKFREGVHSNLFSCISAALDKLARQSVYNTEFFWVVDNLINSTLKTSMGKSVLHVLKES